MYRKNSSKFPLRVTAWLTVLVLATLAMLKISDRQKGDYYIIKNTAQSCVYYQTFEYADMDSHMKPTKK